MKCLYKFKKMKAALTVYLAMVTMLYIASMTQMASAAVQMTDTSTQMMQLMNTSLGRLKVSII